MHEPTQKYERECRGALLFLIKEDVETNKRVRCDVKNGLRTNVKRKLTTRSKTKHNQQQEMDYARSSILEKR